MEPRLESYYSLVTPVHPAVPVKHSMEPTMRLLTDGFGMTIDKEPVRHDLVGEARKKMFERKAGHVLFMPFTGADEKHHTEDLLMINSIESLNATPIVVSAHGGHTSSGVIYMRMEKLIDKGKLPDHFRARLMTMYDKDVATNAAKERVRLEEFFRALRDNPPQAIKRATTGEHGHYAIRHEGEPATAVGGRKTQPYSESTRRPLASGRKW